jgi:hypothetical protein
MEQKHKNSALGGTLFGRNPEQVLLMFQQLIWETKTNLIAFDCQLFC